MSQTKLYLFTAASTLEAIKISGSMDESMDGDVGVIKVEVRAQLGRPSASHVNIAAR